MAAGSFGDLVAAGRVAAGVSRAELGAAVGSSEATVRNWEQGRSTPDQDEVLRKLSLALDLPEDVLREAAVGEDAAPTVPAHDSLPLAPPPSGSVDSYRSDKAVMVTYWIRGLLTAVALVALAVVLVWALAELLDLTGELFGSGP